ncbi:MAG: RimK/LysX family protein [Hyphomicrobiaceae bacterium]
MPAPFIMGWEEWVALPELGLPAIKAKIDTGARTSALHAHQIEPFGPADQPLVRFAVHPIAGRTDIDITCSAPVIGRRDVTSSNGERERRYVISTPVRMGGREWPIEVTLTNRESMAYRMLIGRQAIMDDMFVDPASSFRQRKLSYAPYKHLPRRDPVQRLLRLAILTRKPTATGPRRLATAAAEHGHVVETLEVGRLALAFDEQEPGLMLDGARLPHFDAIVPRIGGSGAAYARAVLRQLELMGSYSLNPASALDRLASLLSVRQRLARHGVPTTGPARLNEETAVAALDDTTSRRRLSVLVVGRTAVAALESRRGILRPMNDPLDKPARKLAVRAARALGLRLAAIDLAAAGEDYIVSGCSAVPAIARFHADAGFAVERHIIADVESHVRSWVRHTEGESAADATVAASEG